MSISAAASGKIIVEFSPNGVSGRSAASGFLIVFSTNYSMPAWAANPSSGIVDNIKGISNSRYPVWFQMSHAKISLSEGKQFLGFAYSECMKTFKPISHETNGGFLIELFLSSEQIECIEKARAGGDVVFDVKIIGEYYDEYNHLATTEYLIFRVNQKEWMDALKMCGYGNYILYEMQMPAELSDNFKPVLDIFEQAKKQLYYGEYDVVVAKCRESVDLFLQLANMEDKFAEAKGLYRGNKDQRESMTKAQRRLAIIESIRHFSHGAHHPDNGARIYYSRSDALSILGATAGAVSAFTVDLMQMETKE